MGILSNFRLSFNNIFFTPVLYGVVASLAVFLTAWDKGDRLKDKFHDKFRVKQDTFDFVIVGAGTAGSVLAHRLSAYYSVLLLEEGGEPHVFQAIPRLSLFMPNYPTIDWQFNTIRQKRACFACVKGQSLLNAGKNLGGTSNLNFLVHLRPHREDFHAWTKITGDPSWSYEKVLPFFKISEDFIGKSTDENAHGKGGPLTIELPDYQGLSREFIWAGQEFGYPNIDLNGDYKEGFDAIYHPIRRGVRQATYRSFIQPARRRKSLTIRKFAHVNKILLRGNDQGAYGVEYDRHLKSEVAYATKEVIISAGTVNSPKLLMLSGIGPWQHLNDVGIPVRVDLPVGQNLQDHLGTLVGPFFIDKPRSFLLDRDITAKSFLEWGAHGSGVLSSSGISATGIFASTIAQDAGEGQWPDIQLSLLEMAVHKTFSSDIAHAFGFKEEILKKYYWHAHGKESFQIIASNARPVARGEIRLLSKNPYDPPVIDPRYLEDPWDADIKRMIESVKTAIALVENSTNFQNLGGRLTDEPFPNCEHHWFRSDPYWECYIRQYSLSLRHVVGTNAMGSVLDSKLKVKGTKALRVIDASSIPQVPVAGTQAAVIMIAEKGAQMILDYWKSEGHLDNAKHDHYSGFANSLRGEKPTPDDPFGNPFGIPIGDMPILNNLDFGFSNTLIKNPFEGLLTSFSDNYNSAPTKNPFEEFFAGLFKPNEGNAQEEEAHEEEAQQPHGENEGGDYGDPNLNTADSNQNNKNVQEQERNLRQNTKGNNAGYTLVPPISNYSSTKNPDSRHQPENANYNKKGSMTIEKAHLIEMHQFVSEQTPYNSPPTRPTVNRHQKRINSGSHRSNTVSSRKPQKPTLAVVYSAPQPQNSHIHLHNVPSVLSPTVVTDSYHPQNTNINSNVDKSRRSKKKPSKLTQNYGAPINNIADIISPRPSSNLSPTIQKQNYVGPRNNIGDIRSTRPSSTFPPIIPSPRDPTFLDEVDVLNFQSQKLHVVNPGQISTRTVSGNFQPLKVVNTVATGSIRDQSRRIPSSSNIYQQNIFTPQHQVLSSPNVDFVYSHNLNHGPTFANRRVDYYPNNARNNARLYTQTPNTRAVSFRTNPLVKINKIPQSFPTTTEYSYEYVNT